MQYRCDAYYFFDFSETIRKNPTSLCLKQVDQ